MGGSFINFVRRCFRKRTKKSETVKVKCEKTPLISIKNFGNQTSQIVMEEIREFKFIDECTIREKSSLLYTKVEDDDEHYLNVLESTDLIDLSSDEDAVVPSQLVVRDEPNQSDIEQQMLNTIGEQQLKNDGIIDESQLCLFNEENLKHTKDPNSSRSSDKDISSNEEMDDERLMVSKRRISSDLFYDKELESSIIIDNGSCYCRAGFAYNAKPRTIFSSVIGKPKYPNVMNMAQDYYVGDEAQKNRGILRLHYPIKNDKEDSMIDWNDMEMIWQYAFQKLNAMSEEHPVILTEQPLSSYEYREHMHEILFEAFNVPAACIVNQAVSSLFAYGKSTGVVLDSGNGVTHVVPIYKGYALTDSTLCLNLAGRSITEYLGRLLYERGHRFSTSAELEHLRDMKERHAYVSMDFISEISMKQRDHNVYTLPDGQTIQLGNERFKCTEAMFRPYLIGLNEFGVHDAVYKTIQHVNSQYECVYTNDVDLYLSGGNTRCDGFSMRLQSELNNLVTSKMSINVIDAGKKGSNLAWTGARLMVQSDEFKDRLVTKKMYNEYGSSIYHRKFSI